MKGEPGKRLLRHSAARFTEPKIRVTTFTARTNKSRHGYSQLPLVSLVLSPPHPAQLRSVIRLLMSLPLQH